MYDAKTDDVQTMTVRAIHQSHPNGVEIEWGGVEGDLVDMGLGAHDQVFDYLSHKLSRFVNGWIPHNEPIGVGYWIPNGRGGYELDRIEIRDEILSKYGVENTTETEADLEGTVYEDLTY